MKHLDLFSGYGGFALSMPEEIDTIGFAEVDKYASKVLDFNYPNIKNYGDVTKIDFRQFNGEVDIITGGTPCQDLSIAGKQRGLTGARSGLFFEFIRSITESKPRYFIWENVKGALSSSKGWDFARVQIEMAQAGYSIQWVVLNAKDYGVPQNRERIFAIGTRGKCRREILCISEGSEQASKRVRDIRPKVSDAERVYYIDGATPTLKALGGGLGAKTGLYAIPTLTPNRIKKRQSGRRFKEDGEPSFCITGQDRHGVYDGVRIRRLTPLECERCMGIPDNWTSCNGEISDTQRYKMCGNGVVPQCVQPLLSFLNLDI